MDLENKPNMQGTRIGGGYMVVVYGSGLVVVYGYGFGAVVVDGRGDDDGAATA